MAAEGEERVLTLYADIHYYFGEPGPRPANHRFDKESYVYLYGDARARRGRIEIANHAGTAEQDAFTGYLDNVTIVQSARHPTLCTLTVNGAGNKALPDQHWRLPSTDPRDEGKYQFKLHTLDFYFWTDADAMHFVQAVSMLLRNEQVQSDALPVSSPPAHEQPMSPVVQNLENLAVSHNSSKDTRNAQNRDSIQSEAAFSAGRASTGAGATGAGLATGQQATVASPAPPSVTSSTDHAREPQNFTPLTYNPAAPAAPEKIAHREPTPPPPEGDTGLTGAALRDAGHLPPAYQATGAPTPSFGPSATPSFGPGAPSTIGGMASPAWPVPQTFSPHSQGGTPLSFSQPPTTASSVSTQQTFSPSSRTSTTAAPNFPGAPSRTTSVQSGFPQATPTHEILGPNFQPSQVPLQHIQPQYPDYLAQRISQNNTPSSQAQGYHAPGSQHNKPHGVPANVAIGGYSDYNYSAPPDQQAAGGYHDANPYDTGDYAIHQQVYRPTEQEVSAHRKNSKHKAEGEARAGKLEAGAERVEKKVNRFLRGLEKKIG